jgi:hypothetical protein
MNYDPSQIATRDLRLCHDCQYEARPQDKFCRRCGVRLADLQTGEVGSPASQRLSGALGAGFAKDTGRVQSRPARRALSVLISIPIWLIIIFLSPLEAYLSVRGVARYK